MKCVVDYRLKCLITAQSRHWKRSVISARMHTVAAFEQMASCWLLAVMNRTFNSLMWHQWNLSWNGSSKDTLRKKDVIYLMSTILDFNCEQFVQEVFGLCIYLPLPYQNYCSLLLICVWLKSVQSKPVNWIFVCTVLSIWHVLPVVEFSCFLDQMTKLSVCGMQQQKPSCSAFQIIR